MSRERDDRRRVRCHTRGATMPASLDLPGMTSLARVHVLLRWHHASIHIHLPGFFAVANALILRPSLLKPTSWSFPNSTHRSSMFQLPFRPKPPAKEDDHLVQDSLATPDDENDNLNQIPSPSTRIYGHDDASDTLLQQPPSPINSTLESLSDDGSDHKDFSPPTPLISSPGASGSSSSSSGSNASAPTSTLNSNFATKVSQQPLLPFPTSSPGPVTHAHQVAMANRIELADLEPGGIFDPALYTPVFLHDTLMLPGSLANLLGKVRKIPIFLS